MSEAPREIWIVPDKPAREMPDDWTYGKWSSEDIWIGATNYTLSDLAEARIAELEAALAKVTAQRDELFVAADILLSALPSYTQDTTLVRSLRAAIKAVEASNTERDA